MFRIDSATAAQFAAATTVALVIAGSLLSGPALGVIPLEPDPNRDAGEGTATVSTVSIDYDEFRLSLGRFGTDVTYLRIPDAVVDVTSVTDRARLVYRVQVPEIGVEEATSIPIDSGGVGRHRIRLADRALDDDPGSGPYDVIVQVRVQSFAVDETIVNETVQVGGDA